jgi:DTW domain-containing protein
MSVDIFSANEDQIEWTGDADSAESDETPEEHPTSRPCCERCCRPMRVCLCHCLPLSPIAASIDVVVLQTRAESRARVGTAALLPLVLTNATVSVLRSRRADAALLNGDDAVLLFPGQGSVPLDTYPKAFRTLVVLDGSWEGAYRILRTSPAIRSLPQVRLPDQEILSSPPLFLARRPPVNIPGA